MMWRVSVDMWSTMEPSMKVKFKNTSCMAMDGTSTLRASTTLETSKMESVMAKANSSARIILRPKMESGSMISLRETRVGQSSSTKALTAKRL
jgi:hypothetical protein